jgi:hypothetical protein
MFNLSNSSLKNWGVFYWNKIYQWYLLLRDKVTGGDKERKIWLFEWTLLRKSGVGDKLRKKYYCFGFLLNIGFFFEDLESLELFDFRDLSLESLESLLLLLLLPLCWDVRVILFFIPNLVWY